MGERGSALAEALIVVAIVGVIWAAAARVLAQVPSQAARWEDAAAMRQRIRVIDARIGRMVAGAAPIAVDVDGRTARIPAIWPRRLGLFRPGAAGEVSASAVTFISRPHGQRTLTLAGSLAVSGGDVTALPQPGCGSESACGLREGDTVLVVADDGACGLYRVEQAGSQLRLAPLMPPGAASFGPGSVLMRVVVDALSFDADEGAIRRYDGYRSDNIMVDGVRSLAIDWAAFAPLGDGPFVGTGPLAYDADQLALAGISMTIELEDSPPATGLAALRRITPGWGLRAWP